MNVPKFSNNSKAQLASCDQRLQDLFNAVIEHWNCTIIEGYRNRQSQEADYAAGKTKLHWPNGNHNKNPSLAVDVMPYPIKWDDIDGIKQFAGFVKTMATHMKIPIVWGGDWKTFKDYDHYEIKQ